MPHKLKNIELRSEEVQEILTQVPHWMIRWGNIILLALILLVLFTSWFVKYPDVIETNAYLTTINPAQKVYARSTGRIDTIFVSPNEKVRNGSSLALLENSARYKDIKHLKKVIDTIDVSKIDFNFPLQKLPILFLGEIEQNYAIFENNYIAYSINKNFQPFSNEANAQILKLSELKLQLRNLISQSSINKKELDLKKNDLKRSRSLFEKGVIAEREYENKQIEFLQSQRNYDELISLRSQLRDAINSTEMNSRAIEINKTREDISLFKTLIQSLNQLRKSIKDWEYKYLLKSQEAGTVSFMNYWNKNQTVEEGEIIFTVIPEKNNQYIAKLSAPSRNSGKIKAGQFVNIKLSNFPDNEFGFLKGKISNISIIPDDNQNYIVDVALPDSLYTSYGKKINYKPEMSGSAEIITEDLRLFERIFIQFKQLLSR